MHRVDYVKAEVVHAADHAQEEVKTTISIQDLYMIDWEIANHVSHVVEECNQECVVEDYKLIIPLITIIINNSKDHAVVADSV